MSIYSYKLLIEDRLGLVLKSKGNDEWKITQFFLNKSTWCVDYNSSWLNSCCCGLRMIGVISWLYWDLF